MKTTITVVISAFNEEKNITSCLESASWTDEIILIDNTSTDDTVKLAKKYTDKIFTRPNNPMLNINKNFGFGKATGDWILNIDADESVTPELAKEIQEVLVHKEDLDGYYIPRKNILFGKWIQHTGWYPDFHLRLFRKGKGSFPENHVHEHVTVNGATTYATGHIEHHNYDSIAQFIQKMFLIYAPNEAKELKRRGYQFDWKDAMRFPFQEFLSRFFAREGYKDGYHGLMLSLLQSFYHFVVFAYLWEDAKFPSVDGEDMLAYVKKQQKLQNKELAYWFANEALKKMHNPLTALRLRIQRKVRR